MTALRRALWIKSIHMLALAASIGSHVTAGSCQMLSPSDAGSGALGATPRWVTTGNLSTSRYGHTATLLANGQVLVVGGADSAGNTLDSAELYDPDTGSWVVTGHMNERRTNHTTTLLPDGRALVVGGVAIMWDDPYLVESAELYDPATATWRFTGSPTAVGAGHTATLLKTGKVLVAGGASQESVMAAGALYDPATGSWSETGSLITPRAAHQATLLQDGRVLVSGGDGLRPGNSVILTSAEIYDPISGGWSPAADLIYARTEHSATLLSDGSVLILGGFVLRSGAFYAAELFHPSTGQWRATGSLSAIRLGHTATLLADGRVLVAGGAVLDSTELYDPIAGSWSDAAHLNAPRAGHTATLLPNGNVLVAGGGADGNTAELYGVAFPPGTIDAAFTGSWFDPTQSGHGLFVQVLPDNQFLAAWFTFNPAGTEQSWFIGTGTYSGTTATVTSVVQPTGGRWIPNFDSSRVVNNPWGSLTFTFTDCNHGKVDFNSTMGYGVGSMNLTRLTQPVGLSC